MIRKIVCRTRTYNTCNLIGEVTFLLSTLFSKYQKGSKPNKKWKLIKFWLRNWRHLQIIMKLISPQNLVVFVLQFAPFKPWRGGVTTRSCPSLFGRKAQKMMKIHADTTTDIFCFLLRDCQKCKQRKMPRLFAEHRQLQITLVNLTVWIWVCPKVWVSKDLKTISEDTLKRNATKRTQPTANGG